MRVGQPMPVTDQSVLAIFACCGCGELPSQIDPLPDGWDEEYSGWVWCPGCATNPTTEK